MPICRSRKTPRASASGFSFGTQGSPPRLSRGAIARAATCSVAARARKVRRMARQEISAPPGRWHNLWKRWRRASPLALIFAAAVTIFYTVIFIIPFGTAIWLSFQNWDFITQPRFVGLRNYTTMFKSAHFWQALKTTVMFSAVEITVGVSLALLLALLLSRMKGRWERSFLSHLLSALRHSDRRIGLPLALALPQHRRRLQHRLDWAGPAAAAVPREWQSGALVHYGDGDLDLRGQRGRDLAHRDQGRAGEPLRCGED